MRKILIALLIVVQLLSANKKDKDDENFQIFATNIEYDNNIITATGDVVMFSPTYYITAKKVVYDKAKNQVSLYEDVNILKDNSNLSISDYSFIEFEVSSLSKFVFMLYENDLWVESAQVSTEQKDTYFESSLMSSCDCQNPDWSIRFSSGSHSDDYSWLHTFNNRIYIKDVPVFYLPYFAVYTNTKRHSGLLIPKLGYSKGEGFIYMQPFYYAPEDNWDIELVPQHRAKRGNGLYAYFRYADSPDSMLEISSGYFKEKDKYKVENELKNDRHYGVGLLYERRYLYADKNQEFEDGLYVDLDFLRDVEYKTLSDTLSENSTPSKVESKLNYFIKDNKDYLGTYFRYYKNISDSSINSQITKKRTLQQLPTVHYHRFSSPIISQKLLYSTDVQYTNHYRSMGLRAKETSVSLPFFYGFNLFDDYLNISLQEELYFAHIDYDENDIKKSLKDAKYAQARHSISASTNLIKEYDTLLHTINLGSTLYVPSGASKRGDIYELTNNTDTELRSFPIVEESKNLAFWLSHSFYDKDFANMFLNHKIRQNIIYDDFGDSSLGNMENELIYYHKYGSISNRFLYNHQDNKVILSSSGLDLNYENYFLNTSHYWTKKTLYSNMEDSETIDYKLGFHFWKNYTLSYRENYNLYEKTLNIKEFALAIDKSCWSLQLSIMDELVSASTIDNSAKRQDIIYLMLQLKPIGGLEHRFVKESKVSKQ